MKKRILLAISTLLILGMTIAVFAFSNQTETRRPAMDCCAKTDACPLKDKDQTTAGVDLKNVVVVSAGEDCCTAGADCCKGGGAACCKGKHN